MANNTTLGGLAEFSSGGTPSKVNAAYWGGDVPWLSAKDMKSLRVFDTEDHVTSLGAENGTRFAKKGATLLLTRGMTLLSDVPICLAGRDLTFNQDVKALTARQGVDSNYLLYTVLAAKPALLAMVDLAGHGTGRLPTDTVKALPVRLPPLPEQRAIAELLGALDDKIELNRRMNETLEAMARALFKSWFVDFDPVRAKAEGRAPASMDAATAARFPAAFDQSDSGVIPAGWNVATLGEIVQRAGGHVQTGPFGSQLHAGDYVEHGIPVVMPTNIAHRAIDRTGIARIREEDAERLRRHRLVQGDLVYSRRGDVEKHALVSTDEQGWLCGTGCLMVRPGCGGISSLVLSLQLDQPHVRAWISSRSVGATMPNLNTTILGEVPLLVPSAEVQEAFEGIVAPMEDKKHQNGREAHGLSALRDLLLPKLLSGEFRVRDAEKAVEKVA